MNWKHLLLMLAGCTLPLLLIFIAPLLGIKGDWPTFIFIIAMMACHLYMTLLMVRPMAIVMLFLMKMMYPDKKKNLIIYMSSALVFILSLTLLRTPVGDVQYMKAMIPHHSSAILTSKNADLKDPEIKKLAEEIIKAQEKEISQMKAALDRLKK